MDTNTDRSPLTIRTPCPKRWEELSGDGRRRFCSECSLHVHNAAALTRREAEALVARDEGRVCMRIEYDAHGAPVHKEPRAARVVRWLAGTGAALLAACHGASEPVPPTQPAEPPSRLGEAVAPAVEMGGVAAPEPLMGMVAAPVEMGDVVVQPKVRMGVGDFEVVPQTAPVKPK